MIIRMKRNCCWQYSKMTFGVPFFSYIFFLDSTLLSTLLIFIINMRFLIFNFYSLYFYIVYSGHYQVKDFLKRPTLLSMAIHKTNPRGFER